MSRLTRDGTAEPVSDQILRHARGQGDTIFFPVQLTTCRVGNLTRLIHTLLYVMTIHTYIHTYIHTSLRMDITTEAGALFDNHPRLKNKALLLDITIVNPYAGSNLGNAARHVGKHLADAVERKKNKYRGSFPATYSLLSLAMPTCGKVGSDVYALIKELAIRQVQHRSETRSNGSQHLAEATEVARLRRRFSFVLQQALSFRTRHHLCRQGVALASTRPPHSQGPRLYKRIVAGG